MAELTIAQRDRQELWRLVNFLAVNGTNDKLRQRGVQIYHYLAETCTHEFSDVSGWAGSPKGTHQCDWCNLVVSLDELLTLKRIEDAAENER